LPGLTGFEQWRVEPVQITSSWMPRAQFNHAAHRSSTCMTCHRGADESRTSSDVLMPDIKQCRDCHRGSRDRLRLASDCTMCHRLHLPGRGDLTAGGTDLAAPPAAPPAARPAAPAGTASIAGVP
jgi:c(7)-type cytochrome triheme protein